MRRSWPILALALVVACGSSDEPPVATPSGFGSLELVVTAAGSDRDLQYVAATDSGQATESGKPAFSGQPVAWTLPAGPHTLSLGDVASNCTADGPETRSVTIASDETTRVEVAVTCTALAFVRATMTVSGAAPVGMQFSLLCPDLVVGSCGDLFTTSWTAAREFVFGMGAGRRVLEVLVPQPVGVPDGTAWCAVNGGSTATVPVDAVAGDTVDVTIDVVCRAVAGTLSVIAHVGGTNVDHGVTIYWGPSCRFLDDCEASSVGGGGSAFTGAVTASVTPGEYEVVLGDIAENCRVTGEGTRRVHVPFEGVAEVVFDVTCT